MRYHTGILKTGFRLAIVLSLCCCIVQISLAQKKKFVIANAIDKGDYFYIPRSALADSVSGILHPDMHHRKVSLAKKPIELIWTSMCNDGYFILYITPEQIFFRSGHDNPNPNYLYWVVDIDSLQFRAIRDGITRNPPKGFQDHSDTYMSQLLYWDVGYKDGFAIPEEWTEQSEKRFTAYCGQKMQDQLKKFSAILNSYLSRTNKKINLPITSQIPSVKPKYFGSSRNDLRGGVIIEEHP